MSELVLLNLIQPHVAAQPRAAVNIDKVAEYVEDLGRGDEFPPMVTFFDGEKHWLADGFHRFYAAKTAALESFRCEVRKGGVREAILYSCSANASHGLRRTTKDKQRAVAKLLDDEEWGQWSPYEIARYCAVSEFFVRKISKEYARYTTFNRSTDGEKEVTFVHWRAGKTKMKVSKIGKTVRQLPPLEPRIIADKIKLIRSAIGVLPSPAEAAEQFPAEQRYFHPISDLRRVATWMSEFADEMEKQLARLGNEQRAS